MTNDELYNELTGNTDKDRINRLEEEVGNLKADLAAIAEILDGSFTPTNSFDPNAMCWTEYAYRIAAGLPRVIEHENDKLDPGYNPPRPKGERQ